MTIANDYIQALVEHRGAPGQSRALATYVDDPYNMSPSEYRRAKKAIKAEFKEKNRAEQKKLNRAAFAAVRRKPQKWLSYREKKNKLLADLETKFKRSQIDREYGNVPGEWREDETGRYPKGTQGKSAARRRRDSNRQRSRTQKPRYDVEAEYSDVQEPAGYLPPGSRERHRPQGPRGPQRPQISPRPGYKALPPSQRDRPTTPTSHQLPPGSRDREQPREEPKQLPRPEPRNVTPGYGQRALPAGSNDRMSKRSAAAAKVKKRRGSRR